MLKIKLLKHQERFVEFANKHRYVLCGDEMGLGKTASSLAVWNSVGRPSLTVVCPAFLKENWIYELEKVTGYTNPETGTILGDVNIISYSMVRKFPKVLKKKVVILDEFHYIKNMQSQRTKAIHRGIDPKVVERLMLLSGTPITNRVPDIYSPLRLVSKEDGGNNGRPLYPDYRTVNQFSHKFCNVNQFSFLRGGRRVQVVKFTGLKNKELLKKYMRGKYIRRTSDKVLDLPSLRRITVKADYAKFTLGDELEKAWEQAKEGEGYEHYASLKKASAVSKATFTAKFTEETLENTGNAVVFSDHPHALEEIQKRLPKKYTSVVIDGGVLAEKRMSYVRKFQDGEIDVLLLSIGAASTGITLTRSRIIIFNDISWSPSDNAQAEKRIHRIGQGKSCNIYFITGSKVDEDITRSNIEKIETNKELL